MSARDPDICRARDRPTVTLTVNGVIFFRSVTPVAGTFLHVRRPLS
jgi:hypothetical protein